MPWMMRPCLRWSLALALVCVAACHLPPPQMPIVALAEVALTSQSADQALRPGDFLFRYVNPKDRLGDKVIGGVIKGGQIAVEATSSLLKLSRAELSRLLEKHSREFEGALVRGDPNTVHMGIYLGGGDIAEAYGTSLGDAKVGLWRLFDKGRLHTVWRVFRHRDPRIAAAVAEVARRWALTGRMGYRVPVEVIAHSGDWDDSARSAAFEFARAYDIEGGPPVMSSMFCSQFAVAVGQSAVARVALASSDPQFSAARLDDLPPEFKLNAIASPLHVYGQWQRSGAFELVGQFVTE